MEKFQEGKKYRVNGGGVIKIIRRTRNFITFCGDFSGRRRICEDNLFGLGENILIPSDFPAVKYFCFAGHEKTQEDFQHE